MQIEATEKEAREIYSQRFYANLGKKRFLPIIITAVALVTALLVMYYVNDWLGVGVFVLLSSPSIYMTLKEAKTSKKYAKREIEEQG